MPIVITPVIPPPETVEPLPEGSVPEYVATFNARSGVVVPAVGDYLASYVLNDSGVDGVTVENALDTLNTGISASTAHIADATVHFTQASISITESQISDLSHYSHPTGDGNLHVPANSTTNNGKVLTASGVAGTYTWETPASGVTDHTLLSNIGVNTHAQIDTHIADATVHFTQAAISITESQISDLSHYTHPTGDGNLHVPANSTTNNGKVLTAGAVAGTYTWETSPAGVTDHTGLSNIGTNTHAQIDSHMADATLHFTQASISITESQISDLSHYAHPTGDGNLHVPANSTTNNGKVLTASATAGVYTWETSPAGVTDHTGLSNIGTNTHAQIDTHIADGTVHFTEASLGLGSIATQAASAVAITGGTIAGITTLNVTGDGIFSVKNKLHQPGVNSQTGTAYTGVLTDAEKITAMNNASANVFTIPTNAAVAYDVNTTLTILMEGAGVTSITADTGVTVNGVLAGSAVINGQYQAVTLIKRATNTWIMFGAHGTVA